LIGYERLPGSVGVFVSEVRAIALLPDNAIATLSPTQQIASKP
jgi:hypothetical protein